MLEFMDQNGKKVELTFSKHTFLEEAKHVLVICQYEDRWVLTKHKIRGLEFHGGKREAGETLEEAAKREVYEETGAILAGLQFLAEYKVYSESEAFVKAVYWGQVQRFDQTGSYHETDGPVMIQGDLLHLRFGADYSFIMKDRVVEECLSFIKKLKG